jgi:iron(III) transport system substrate-binding protein
MLMMNPQEAVPAEDPVPTRIRVFTSLEAHLLDIFREALERRALAPEFHVISDDQVLLSRMRLLEEGTAPDILLGLSTVLLDHLAERGLLEPYTPSWGEELEVGLSDRHGRWFGILGDPLAMVYNQEYFEGEDLLRMLPERWDDLGRYPFQGSLVFQRPSTFNEMGYFLACLIDRSEQADQSSRTGFNLLSLIDFNTLRFYPSRESLVGHLFSGEDGALSVMGLSQIKQCILEGLPADFLLPREGVFVYPRGIALVRGASEEARRVYDALTQKEVLRKFAQEHAFVPLMDREGFGLSVQPGERLTLDPFATNHDSVRRNIVAWIGEWQNLVQGSKKERNRLIDDAINTVMTFLIPVALLLVILTSRRKKRRASSAPRPP